MWLTASLKLQEFSMLLYSQFTKAERISERVLSNTKERSVAMSAKDTVTKEYLSDNTRFADLCNYYLFNGKQVIHPEELREQDVTELMVMKASDERKADQKWRDLLKQAVIKRTDTCSYIIIGIENQSEVHYAMPVRNMIYDAMNYGSQIRKAAKRHAKAKDWNNTGEFLSGFAKGEKLMPVVTITIYWGSEKWDGPRSVHEMLTPMDKELLKYMADYRLNLIVPEEITDFRKFRSALGPVLKLFQLAENRKALDLELKNNPEYKVMGQDSMNVVNTFLGLHMQLKEKEKTVDMCKAWEEQREDGVKEGLMTRLVELTIRRFQKGDSAEAVAEFFEEDPGLIRRIYDCWSRQSVDCDVEKICSELLS